MTTRWPGAIETFRGTGGGGAFAVLAEDRCANDDCAASMAASRNARRNIERSGFTERRVSSAKAGRGKQENRGDVANSSRERLAAKYTRAFAGAQFAPLAGLKSAEVEFADADADKTQRRMTDAGRHFAHLMILPLHK